MKRMLLMLMTAIGLTEPVSVAAQEVELRARAEQVVALLRGEGEPEQIFTPAFLAQVPAAQVRAISQRFGAQYGAVRILSGLDVQAPQTGILHVDYERATAHFRLAIEPQSPHRISGLQFTGADMRGDSIEAVLAEIRALPGQTNAAVARLGEGAPQPMAGHQPDRALAVGSAFKLFILAELSRQVQAGQRRWSDVVTLDRHSGPSGTLHAWPLGAPVTLHTLATLMISISDNSATDVLLHLLGRETVEQMMARIGVEAAPRNRPLLSTVEWAVIKTGPDAAVAAWRSADEAERRRLLATAYDSRDPAGIDASRFTGRPLHIDSVEWFASAGDLVRTLDWLRRDADDTARAILAINAALPQRTREAVAYAGFKGGSEPGVLNLSWLIRGQSGQWYAVTGSWNDPTAPVDEARFSGLLTRLVALLR